MKKFPSIESFYHVVERNRSYAASLNVPVQALPPLHYRGRVKLHGTNGGVRVDMNGNVQAQSRTSDLSEVSHNYYFWPFVHKDVPVDVWRDLAKQALEDNNITQTDDVTIIGEWCGQGVIKGTVLTQVPRHFVIFKIYHGDEALLDSDGIYNLDHRIYNISLIQQYEFVLDFTKLDECSQYLNDITAQVEAECPWAKNMFNVSGCGEGLVWMLADREDDRMWFKTKGLLHKVRNNPKNNIAPYDIEKVNSIKECVDIILTEGRMRQMVDQNQLEFRPESIGPFLKFVAQDIIKEEMHVIEGNGLTWKEVGKFTQSVARDWFLKQITLRIINGNSTPE